MYCYNGFEYKGLRRFKTTASRTGKSAATEYRRKLLKSKKYKGKDELLWVDRVGPDSVDIWM